MTDRELDELGSSLLAQDRQSKPRPLGESSLEAADRQRRLTMSLFDTMTEDEVMSRTRDSFARRDALRHAQEWAQIASEQGPRGRALAEEARALAARFREEADRAIDAID